MKSGTKMKNESSYILSSHNAFNLIYHSVAPAEYRSLAATEAVEEGIKQICDRIELRYDPDNDNQKHNGETHI